MEQLAELNELMLTDHYEFKQVLGKGSFGLVVSAYNDKLEAVVAIKIVPRHLTDPKILSIFENEAALLEQCKHNNIVKVHKILYAPSNFYIIMEWVNGDSLSHLISQRNGQPFPEAEILDIIKQLLEALCYIHRKGIVHRDVKPDNIMMCRKSNKTRVLKLIDFGLSFKGTSSQLYAGTPIFIAPEIWQKREYNQQVDMFAVGIIQFMLFSLGVHPTWKHHGTWEHYLEHPEISYPETMGVQAQDFFNKTFAIEPDSRMSSYQCLNHPWITGSAKLLYPITTNEIISVFSCTQHIDKIMRAVLLLLHIKKHSELCTIQVMQPSSATLIIEQRRSSGQDSTELRKDRSFRLHTLQPEHDNSQDSMRLFKKQRVLQLQTRSKDFLPLSPRFSPQLHSPRATIDITDGVMRFQTPNKQNSLRNLKSPLGGTKLPSLPPLCTTPNKIIRADHKSRFFNEKPPI